MQGRQTATSLLILTSRPSLTPSPHRAQRTRERGCPGASISPYSTSTGSTSFGNNLTIFAGDDSIIQAINGNTLDIGGTLDVDLDVFGNSPTTTGNLLRLRTLSGGSAITIGGDAFLSANADGQDALDNGLNGGNATGGSVIVQTASNGSIAILGDLNMSADGTGGDQFFSDGNGGNGIGGTAQILANGDGVFIAGLAATGRYRLAGKSTLSLAPSMHWPAPLMMIDTEATE